MTKQTTETYRVSYNATSGLVHQCEHEHVAWDRFESLGTLDACYCYRCCKDVDVAWVCLDGGEAYCPECADLEGLRFVPCAECGDVPTDFNFDTDSL